MAKNTSQNQIQEVFKQMNAYFDRIFVITLPECTDRQDYIREQFQGLNFEFFHGVDGRKFDLDELDAQGIYSDKLAKAHWTQKSLPKGHLGASWSHKNIHQKIVDENIPRTLILEDDAFPADGISKFQECIDQLPKDWECLYLGYGHNETYGLKQKINRIVYNALRILGLKNKTKNEINNRYARDYSNNLAIAGGHVFLHAYALTPSGAQKLIDKQTPIHLACDHALEELCLNKKWNAFISRPILISQASQEDGKKMKSIIDEYNK